MCYYIWIKNYFEISLSHHWINSKLNYIWLKMLKLIWSQIFAKFKFNNLQDEIKLVICLNQKFEIREICTISRVFQAFYETLDWNLNKFDETQWLITIWFKYLCWFKLWIGEFCLNLHRRDKILMAMPLIILSLHHLRYRIRSYKMYENWFRHENRQKSILR